MATKDEDATADVNDGTICPVEDAWACNSVLYLIVQVSFDLIDPKPVTS